MHWTYWDVLALPASTFQVLLTMLEEEGKKAEQRARKAGPKKAGRVFTATSE